MFWDYLLSPVFKGQVSVLNQPTLRNNPEDGRIQVNHSGSLRSHMSKNCISTQGHAKCAIVDDAFWVMTLVILRFAVHYIVHWL